jgi:hypothetical protein
MKADIDPRLLRAFQAQAALQCRFLLIAARDLNGALQQHDVTRAFYALQNLLTAGANLSKVFWGQAGKFSKERQPLRDSVGVNDDAALKSVTMRNKFEHFGEALDKWFKKSKNHNKADLLIGPRGMIGGLADTEQFRHFDPATGDVIFWGEGFNIVRLIQEAQTLLPKLEAEANKRHQS